MRALVLRLPFLRFRAKNIKLEKRIKNFVRLVCILAIVVLCTDTARAQQVTGNIRGIVEDASGGTVPDAKVTAIHVETGLERTAQSDAQGDFLLVELPAGHYRVEAEAKGFQKFIQQGISLGLNQTATQRCASK